LDQQTLRRIIPDYTADGLLKDLFKK
jgi:hypothetical protein